jgi:hypothetical protein
MSGPGAADEAGSGAGKGGGRRKGPRAGARNVAATPAGTRTAGAPTGGTVWPGFWLPAPLRERFIGPDTGWQEATFARGLLCGAECPTDAPGAVMVRWPAFTPAEWAAIVAGLRAAREKAPRGPEYWVRLQAALNAAAGTLADHAAPQTQALITALSGFTGYSTGMMAAALGSLGRWGLDKMAPALRYQPDKVCCARWHEVPGLPGRVRFFPSKSLDKAAGWVPVAWEMPLYGADIRPGTVVGLATDNIPGSALTMAILALVTTLRGEAPLPRQEPPPAVLLCNSTREPILTPFILSAVEEVDPELISMVAAGIWDDGDAPLHRSLLSEADLVIAAGDDDSGPALSLRAASLPKAPRVHQHGRGVSFTVISREVLEAEATMDAQGWAPPGDTELMDIVALLAGLDSAFWDQEACLSSRMHFVEKGGPADDFPAEYARRLTKRLRQIDEVIPRGAWPVSSLHGPFDRYKAIEGADRWGTGLQVMSDYDDPFVVVLDARTGKGSRLDRNSFASMVDDCRTRVVIVRPVDDVMEVPWRYLSVLPPRALQSLSVAFGRQGQGVTKQFLDFATACGRQGVTAIRPVGRGAFPQLAYSWDGLLPLDLVGTRPSGHFCTIESEAPFDDMMAAYRDALALLAKLPTAGRRGAAGPR